MNKAILDYDDSKNGYVVSVGSLSQPFDSYLKAFTHAKKMFMNDEVFEVENRVFPDWHLMK